MKRKSLAFLRLNQLMWSKDIALLNKHNPFYLELSLVNYNLPSPLQTFGAQHGTFYGFLICTNLLLPKLILQIKNLILDWISDL